MAFVTPFMEHWLNFFFSLMPPSGGIDPMTYGTMSRHSTTELSRSPLRQKNPNIKFEMIQNINCKIWHKRKDRIYRFIKLNNNNNTI